MEAWSFPASYDENYVPDASSRYWFRERETMPASAREARILERLQQVCTYAYAHAPFYRSKWDEAGFHPSQLRSLEDFESKVPVVQKKDLRAAQARAAPFGDYLCVPESDIFHIHGTSGTTGRPTAFAIGRNDWRAMANAHARVMWAMGLRPGDTICVAAIFSLYLGSWGALAGAERLGARCFPFGAGVAGMSARCAQWLNLVKPTAFYGTPTYALHLAQVAADEGLDPRDFKLSTMFFSGEPGASIPGVRNKIEELYGARVIRLRLHGRDDTVDEHRRNRGDTRHAVLAGHRLHRGVRPADHAARPLRRAWHAGLYPPRADVAADDPPGLG